MERRSQSRDDAAPAAKASADGQLGAWVWHVHADRLEMEPACAALHGIEALEAQGMTLRQWLGRAVGADALQVESAMRAAAASGSEYRYTYDILARDGALRRVLSRGRGFGAGEEQRVLGVLLDVTELESTEPARSEDPARFRSLADSIDQMIWSTRPDGFHDYYNSRWYEYTGAPLGSTDGEGWNGMFHPDDQERAWAVWRQSLATGEPYHIEYRLRHRSGQYRWVIGRAQCVRDPEGRILRWYGTCTDIHDLKQAQAERELIAQELSHRIKNMFAVISSLVSISARGYPDARPFSASLQARISALAMAHEYIRPHSAGSAPPGTHHTLHGLLATLTAAYQTEERTRIAIAGDDIGIGQQAATSFALIVHELCTNAVKYGALSTERGTVSMFTSHAGAAYRLNWHEREGPLLTEIPERRGFGTTLSERVVSAQLKATVEYAWLPNGLSFTITVPVERLGY